MSRRPALACALVACLNAVSWSIVTPPFEVPDEPSHFAYVKQLEETGRLPSSASGRYSYEELATLGALRYYQVRQQPQRETIAARSEQSLLERALRVVPSYSEKGSPAAGVAASQPPLYYAIEAIPYALARSGTLLARLQLMRLTSALMAGLTAMFAFLFLREALPREPWAWTVGGLAVALVPLLGLMSGAVNPDALLFVVSSAIFYCLARAFRRGLGTRDAAALGALLAIGFLTKLNFIGLVPGVILGLVVLSVRRVRAAARSAHAAETSAHAAGTSAHAAGTSAHAAGRSARAAAKSAYLPPVLALGIGLIPVALYAVINLLSNHPTLGLVSSAAHSVHGSLLAQIDYIWQLYLPRLPGTANDFPGLWTSRQLWFDGYVGLYGWLDTTFPSWVYSAALVPAAAIALLCACDLYISRTAVRGRAAELAVYATLGIGLMALVGAASYRGFPSAEAEFAQTRYLLPLIPLLGAVVALAARGAGRRYGPAAGALIVVLFLAHDIFSQMLEAGRFYG